MNDNTTRTEVCLTCGETIQPRSNGWVGGNNPWPLNDLDLAIDLGLEARRVCGDCNAIYVIPARLGHEVSGNLYDTDGSVLGTFGSVSEVPC